MTRLVVFAAGCAAGAAAVVVGTAIVCEHLDPGRTNRDVVQVERDARRWARRNGLPWNPPGDSRGALYDWPPPDGPPVGSMFFGSER